MVLDSFVSAESHLVEVIGREMPTSKGGVALPQNAPGSAVQRVPLLQYSAQGCGVEGTTP